MTEPDTFSRRNNWRATPGGFISTAAARLPMSWPQSPDGALQSFKLLSQDPRYDDAALEAVRRCLGIASGGAIPPSDVAELRMGTTVATNALLERKGERVAAGHHARLQGSAPHRLSAPAEIVRAPNRIAGHALYGRDRSGRTRRCAGEVLRPLDEEELRRDLEAARAQGFDTPAPSCSCMAIAIPAHEARAAEHRARARASHRSRPATKPCR